MTAARLSLAVRWALVGIAIGLVGVFATARSINPYGDDGVPATLGTHRQLGLPTCNFLRLTGLPCPSCGMTTSFALLMHGDVPASLRANAAGTVLALTLLAFIPWSLASSARARWLGIRALEPWLLVGVIAITILALARWSVLLASSRWGI